LNTHDQASSTTVLKLYALISQYQTAVGNEQNAIQQEIGDLLKGFTPEQIEALKEQVMGVAADVLTGTTVIMVEPRHKNQDPRPIPTDKQARESYLKKQADGLESNMPKAKLMKVVRAYHAPEQREISFLGPDYKPEDKGSVYFNFREAMYVLRFGSEEDRRVGKGPSRLDHVSGELHQERRKNFSVQASIELSLWP
jgi:hypothetical protein